MSLEERIAAAVAMNVTLVKPNVFRIEDEYVAKECSHFGAHHELTMANLAGRLGIPVPRPLGVFEVKGSHYFVAEFIDGVYRSELAPEEQLRAIEQLEGYVFTLLKTGINPNEALWNENSLYVEAEGKLYVFDFESWRARYSSDSWLFESYARIFQGFKEQIEPSNATV